MMTMKTILAKDSKWRGLIFEDGKIQGFLVFNTDKPVPGLDGFRMQCYLTEESVVEEYKSFLVRKQAGVQDLQQRKSQSHTYDDKGVLCHL